jgi:hypothetical protein
MKKILIIFLFFLPLVGWGKNITSTITGGTYSVTTTWVGGVVPGSTDTATRATTSGHVVTVNVD